MIRNLEEYLAIGCIALFYIIIICIFNALDDLGFHIDASGVNLPSNWNVNRVYMCI